MKTATVDKYRNQNSEVKYRILDGALSSPKAAAAQNVQQLAIESAKLIIIAIRHPFH